MTGHGRLLPADAAAINKGFPRTDDADVSRPVLDAKERGAE